jgi:hypothetical protein
VRRILLMLTNAFRARGADMHRTIEAATELDVLQARARYSDAVDGFEPALSDGAFELQAARHPLLKHAVPVTITVMPPATVLLITGPTTGGKTVALKTAGLLTLMAQAGLRIPAADGSRLPVFKSLFADIGDEQSIENNLSTFSGHIANIASMDRGLVTPALVLLDEVGSGTDPIEGGALGVAIVDHFRRRGATVMATSHYDQLKTYASTTAGVASAAFGFDTDSFAPTYQLIYGSPGFASPPPTGRGCRSSARSSPTSATSSRSRRASARFPRTSRTSRRWTARWRRRRWCCSMKSAPAPIRSKAARSASPSSITSAVAARRWWPRATTTRSSRTRRPRKASRARRSASTPRRSLRPSG